MVKRRRVQGVFKTKREAQKWEALTKKMLVREAEGDTFDPIIERIAEMRAKQYRELPITDLESFKEKYRKMHSSPYNSVADIIDCLMIDLELPISWKGILELIRDSKREELRHHLRAEVLRRDNFTCQWCGAKSPEAELQVDHTIPRSRGGWTELRNLQTLCKSCNIGKFDKPPPKRRLKMRPELYQNKES